MTATGGSPALTYTYLPAQYLHKIVILTLLDLVLPCTVKPMLLSQVKILMEIVRLKLMMKLSINYG